MKFGGVRVEFNKSAVAKRLKKAAERATFIMANEFLKDANELVRMDSGDLKESSQIHSKPEDGLVIWQTPYARQVYYTGRASTDRNPKATVLWAHKAYKMNREKYMRMAQKVVQEEV